LKDIVASMDADGQRWFEETFKELAVEAVTQEIAWWKHIVGNRILGFNDDSIEQFVQYVANKNIFSPFDIVSPYAGVKNPYKHLDLVAGVEDSSTNKGNFFESSNNSYQQVNFSEEDEEW
jgi:ribonucleoside-diphosphate reductase beta chain